MYTKYMRVWLIKSTIHLNRSTKIKFSSFSVFARLRHHTYSFNGLDCICIYKIHVNTINIVKYIHLNNSAKNDFFCIIILFLLGRDTTSTPSMVLTASSYTKHMSICLINQLYTLIVQQKYNFLYYSFLWGGDTTPTPSKGLECIHIYKRHVNMINMINYTP